ncbi:MAG TPA: helix-turn-helix transcriptional regulator [Gemmatimonadaceae bacterium]|nr:helix-turn-helix transcriptional regulator [Gemmatimonadaceae bacterium]
MIRLDDLLHVRRMTLTELSERIGITLANLSILKTGKARAIRFSTLEAICEVLECQPGDLLEYGMPTGSDPSTPHAPVGVGGTDVTPRSPGDSDDQEARHHVSRRS